MNERSDTHRLTPGGPQQVNDNSSSSNNLSHKQLNPASLEATLHLGRLHLNKEIKQEPEELTVRVLAKTQPSGELTNNDRSSSNECKTECKTEDEDEDDAGQSYWSDSAASHCDRISTTTSPREAKSIYLDSSASSSFRSQQQQSTVAANSSHHSPRTGQSRCNSSNVVVRGVRKRAMANERERERTRSLNQALNILRNIIPVREAEKRSKIQTLRTAKEYIEFLAESMQIPQPVAANFSSQTVSSNQTTDHTNGNQLQFNKGPLVTSTTASSTSQISNNNNNHQPDSPLTYLFYKFRLNKNG